MTTQTKSILQSKVFWGVVILIANRYIEIPPEIQEQIPLVAPGAIQSIIDGVGALLAIYGRIKAEKQVKALPWRR